MPSLRISLVSFDRFSKAMTSTGLDKDSITSKSPGNAGASGNRLHLKLDFREVPVIESLKKKGLS